MTPAKVLKQYFGFDDFREGQQEFIDALMCGRDVLGVMPTGAGKSLCYQVPAMLLTGVTLAAKYKRFWSGKIAAFGHVDNYEIDPRTNVANCIINLLLDVKKCSRMTTANYFTVSVKQR